MDLRVNGEVEEGRGGGGEGGECWKRWCIGVIIFGNVFFVIFIVMIGVLWILKFVVGVDVGVLVGGSFCFVWLVIIGMWCWLLMLFVLCFVFVRYVCYFCFVVYIGFCWVCW